MVSLNQNEEWKISESKLAQNVIQGRGRKYIKEKK